MKGGQSDKTKVVIRHLPPGISQATLMEQIDVAFAGRYNWVSFRPGKSSLKHLSYSRAYIDFNRPEDVFEFADFFNGHLYVNEKGTQFKALVEFAPSQRVPKHWSKKDGREGTIYKDPEYLEFVEFISKPVENLPSAEIQLERKEAERAGAPKDAPIITPLMDFVRQRRAAKSGSRRLLSNGKLSRKAGEIRSPSSSASKRVSAKKRTSTAYVLRDAAKATSGKEKSTYILIAKRNDQRFSDKANTLSSASGAEALEDESGKKKILLLKGKEKEISHVSGSMSQQNLTSSEKSLIASTPLKQSPRREASGRIIRNFLLNKDSRQSQTSGVQSEHHRSLAVEKEKRPPRPPQVQFVSRNMNGSSTDKLVGNDVHGFSAEKQEKRTRNKDRLDRVVWTPLRRSDGSYANDESLSSSTPQSAQSGVESSLGSHKHFGRRGPSIAVKDADGSLVEGKPSKRVGASGYGSHEKQVWVQKSSSGS